MDNQVGFRDSGIRTFGYARVSSEDQNLDRQLIELEKYVVYPDREIIIDKQSGKDFDRPNYQFLKNQLLRKGDCLFITELDRLGRNYDQIKKEYMELTEMGINLVILDMQILSTYDKSDLEKKLIANIVFELFAYISEKERIKIRQRCADGITAAKNKGVKFGRPITQKPSNWSEIYTMWRQKNITAVEAMKKTGLKRSTFYRLVKEEK